jgi:hypothetical protein
MRRRGDEDFEQERNGEKEQRETKERQNEEEEVEQNNISDSRTLTNQKKEQGGTKK